jgi:hypothetical protein
MTPYMEFLAARVAKNLGFGAGTKAINQAFVVLAKPTALTMRSKWDRRTAEEERAVNEARAYAHAQGWRIAD